MRRADLPPELRGRVYTVARTATASVPAKRLRASDLDVRVWGVRAPRGTSDDLRGRCLMLAVRLGSHVAFSHTTAARLQGIPVPLARKLDPRIHVSVAAPARAPHANGLVGHQLARVQTQQLAGSQVTTAAQTWRDLGAILPIPDLVAAGDHIIHRRSPMASLASRS